MISLLLAASLVVADDTPQHRQVQDESVVCLENAGSGETMWIALAEKYLTGSRTVRQVELKAGQKRCLRYDRLRNVVVTHYYMSDVEARIANNERIDPWRMQSCERIRRESAVFLKLSSDDGAMTCEVDGARDDAAIRDLVKDARPFSK